ncbi:MAG: hypothetical protein ACXAB7_23395 [Candidatus Kariarchaeaceae archaeon]|jgi:hypothetical protein
MGNFVHRTTRQYLQSFSPNDLPEPIANYIVDPDLSAVQGVPWIYWVITGDVISEMSQGEKDIVDAQILSDARDASIQGQIDDLESVLRQVVIMTTDEINLLRQWIMVFKADVAAANNLAALKSSVAASANLPDRTFSQIKNQLRNNLGS